MSEDLQNQPKVKGESLYHVFCRQEEDGCDETTHSWRDEPRSNNLTDTAPLEINLIKSIARSNNAEGSTDNRVGRGYRETVFGRNNVPVR